MRAARSVAFVLAAIASVPALAHKDTPITWTDTGELRGLPSQFQPARLFIPPSDAGVVSLQFGQVSKTLPSCLTDLFRRVPRSEVMIWASWYHDPEGLPPYINFQ